MYMPESKRRFGYYVLPLLVGDRFVGRFDIRNIRDESTLQIKASFSERKAEAQDTAQKAYAELANLAQFLGAQEIRIDRKGNFSLQMKKASRPLRK